MGEVVNLRRVRRDRARRGREDKAQTNRVEFGRTKIERALTEAETRLAHERHEAHRLEPPKGEE